MKVPGLDPDLGGFGGNWYARDVTYGADTLVENLVGEMDGWVVGFAVGDSTCFSFVMCVCCVVIAVVTLQQHAAHSLHIRVWILYSTTPDGRAISEVPPPIFTHKPGFLSLGYQGKR